MRLSFIYILKLAIPAEAAFGGWADESLPMLEREIGWIQSWGRMPGSTYVPRWAFISWYYCAG